MLSIQETRAVDATTREIPTTFAATATSYGCKSSGIQGLHESHGIWYLNNPSRDVWLVLNEATEALALEERR